MKYKLIGNFSHFTAKGVLPIQYVFSTALICLENVGSGRNALLNPSIQNRIAAHCFCLVFGGQKGLLLFTNMAKED